MIKRNVLKQVFCGLLLCFFALPLMSFTLVIDAGHGGHDTGAVGLKLGVQEKNLNLTVAKQLAAKIREKYPEIKVILTRDSDVFLPSKKSRPIPSKSSFNRCS